MTNKTYKSKFLTVMLGVAMCLALMLGIIFASGTFVTPAYAAMGTGTSDDDPLIVTTFAELQSALLDDSVTYIFVPSGYNLTDVVNDPQAGALLPMKGKKVLNIRGDIKVYTNSTAAQGVFSLSNLLNNDLTLKGYGGTLTFSTGSKSDTAAVYVGSGTKFTIEEGSSITIQSIIGIPAATSGVINNGGTVNLNGGTIIGVGGFGYADQPRGHYGYAVWAKSGTTTIDGADLKSSIRSDGDSYIPSASSSLLIESGANVVLKSATIYKPTVQIDSGESAVTTTTKSLYSVCTNDATKKIADYLDTDKGIVKIGWLPVDYNQSYIEDDIYVVTRHDIESVEATVTLPYVNRTPSTTATFASDNVTLASLKWYKGSVADGNLMTTSEKFVKGQTYIAVVAVAPKSAGYKFKAGNTARTLTINGNAATRLNADTDEEACEFYCSFEVSNNPIYTVSATVTVPKVGESRDKTATVPAVYQQQYEQIGDAIWCKSADLDLNAIMTDEDVFEVGKYYTVLVALKAKDEYEFTPGTEKLFYINNQSAKRGNSDKETDTCVIYYTFLVTDNISAVSVTVDKPVDGYAPSNTATVDVADTDKYEVVKVFGWYKGAGLGVTLMTESAKFVAGEQYTVALKVGAKDGYIFAEANEASRTYKINGTTAANDTVATEVKSKLIYCTFTATTPTNIESVSLTVDPPVAGNAPLETATVDAADTDKYRVFGVGWFKGGRDGSVMNIETDKFVAGEQYTVMVLVKANYGYIFAEANETGRTYKINGTTATNETASTNTELRAIYCTFTAAEHAHTYGTLIPKKEATCTEKGWYAHYHCEECGKYFDESMSETTKDALEISIDDTAHDWNAWVSNGNDTHSRTCKRNAEHKETVNCSGGTATCTEKAVCDVCRTTYGTTKEHTTTQYGGKDGSGHWDTCSTCANKLNFEAHTPDRDKADEAHDKKCTKCGYVIAPAGHYEHTADSEWHNSADGTYHYHKCTYSGCSEILDKAAHSGGKATCEHKAVCEVCGKEYGNVLGHNYGAPTYTWENNVCKAERVCANDGTHKESETVTASGAIVTAATCTEKGKMRYTATFANSAFATQTREVEIDYVAHTFGEWKEEVAPTADTEGVKAHKDCTVCGKHFDKDGNEISNIVIAKIGSAIVTVNGGSGEGSYKIGDEVTVKANDAPEGKEFKGWQDASGNIVSTDVEYKFTVSGEVNLTAVYADKAVDPVDPVEPVDPTDPTDPTEPTIDKEEPKGLSGGAIAGIAVGSTAVAGLGGFSLFWFVIKKKKFSDLIAAIKGIFKKK